MKQMPLLRAEPGSAWLGPSKITHFGYEDTEEGVTDIGE